MALSPNPRTSARGSPPRGASAVGIWATYRPIGRSSPTIQKKPCGDRDPLHSGRRALGPSSAMPTASMRIVNYGGSEEITPIPDGKWKASTRPISWASITHANRVLIDARDGGLISHLLMPGQRAKSRCEGGDEQQHHAIGVRRTRSKPRTACLRVRIRRRYAVRTNDPIAVVARFNLPAKRDADAAAEPGESDAAPLPGVGSQPAANLGVGDRTTTASRRRL